MCGTQVAPALRFIKNRPERMQYPRTTECMQTEHALHCWHAKNEIPRLRFTVKAQTQEGTQKQHRMEKDENGEELIEKSFAIGNVSIRANGVCVSISVHAF